MRGRWVFAVALGVALLVSGCDLGAGFHRVRVAVDAPGVTLEGVAIGDVAYGDVANGTPTGYIGVPEDITHNLSANGAVVGTVLITGFGKHDWTLTIGGNGPYLSFTLTEDPL